MSTEIEDPDVNRRSFLRAAMVTAVAAAATGTTAGLFFKEKSDISETVAIRHISQNIAPITSNTEGSAMQAELAALRAENSRLQIRLSATQSELELARKLGEQAPTPDTDPLRMQLEEANAQAFRLGEEVTMLSGLVNLYEQLDEINLAQVVDDGLTTVGDVLSGLVDEVPLVSQGIQTGQQAIDELEQLLPQVKDGRQWLATQIGRLDDTYSAVEHALSNALDVTEAFMQMLDKWFRDLLKWLPFGIGDKALGVMESMTNFMASIPETIDGLQSKVGASLDLMVADDDGEPRLQRRLIKPVREQALKPASQTINQIETLHAAYQNQLAGPVSTTKEQQDIIRQLIVQYKQQHQL